VRLVRAAFSFFGLDRAGDVRLQTALDGGGLMDVGCYCVSAMRLLAGEPERVSARQVIGGDGVDVRFVGELAFRGGVLGAFDCGLDMVDRSELEVIGDAGSLFLPDPWHSREPRIEVRRPDGTEVIEIPRKDPYACELEDFAAAVRRERPHPFGREDAVAQARTIAALYRAAEFGAEAVP
jgi:xylose dehydrogenase (NAD/NADP)